MHGPSTRWGEDGASAFKTKLGIWMFFIYAIVYATFVLISTLNPALMGMNIGPLNLAIVYGFGLIFFAVGLAFLYNAICTKAEKKHAAMDSKEGAE